MFLNGTSQYKRAAVLGFPINHSLSPRLHNYWLRHYGIGGIYETMEVVSENLSSVLRSLPDKGFSGANLTIPHKERALALVDEIDDDAKRIGAVNTIVIKAGKTFGTNTDAYGFMENLKVGAQNLSSGKAVVVGAGGAARAVCIGLLDDGWDVTLINRTHEKAEALRAFLQHEQVTIAPWDKREEALSDASLLVNTTALGMKGQPPLLLSLKSLPQNACVYDIVYSPLITPLLAEARQRGNKIITGLGMLLYQAQPAFEAWFGVKPEITPALHAHMMEALV